jgi:hypothetical protein
MKKNSKLLAGLLIMVMSIMMIGGCGAKKEESKPVEGEVQQEEDTTEPTEEEEVKEEESEEPATPSADLGDTWVNLDNRSFAVNGTVYTLGVSTLQDMIDGGVPFDEEDIANANNNLNSNTESQNFSIVLGEYYNAQVAVINTTEENKTMAECPISSIYLPVDLEESNDILTFAFPLTMTEDDLLAQAGEPTSQDSYSSGSDYTMNTYEYKVESENYYRETGYKFEFTNGVLSYVTINWIS